jgi:hypothetical protein
MEGQGRGRGEKFADLLGTMSEREDQHGRLVRVARSWVETLKGLTLGVSGGVQGVRLQYF